MSSSERGRRAPAGRLGLAAMLLAAGLAVVSGCTVQPLYSTSPISTSSVTGSIGGELSTVEVKPVTTRVGQQVRNQLIFLFSGGDGQPAQPRYTLNLAVASISESTANIQINKQNEPTAAILTATASYRLTDASGTLFSSGRRQFVSSYDVPRQEFAAYRAKIDAENRAARELAELIRLAVAQDLTRGPPAPADPKS
jgi:LPS-assembly lipoprotein